MKKMSRAIWIVALLAAAEMRAATFTVTNNADSGSGSLRQAIADSAATPEGDEVGFAPALSGATITLASPIEMAGAGVIVDASGLPGGLTIAGGPACLQIFIGSGTLNMVGLTITGSKSRAISVSALRCSRCTFVGNPGGTINAGYLGVVDLSDCTFAGNGNPFGSDMIFIGYWCRLNAVRCTFSGNLTPNGSVIRFEVESYNSTISHCTFTGNSNTVIWDRKNNLWALEPSTITHCTIAGNGGGIANAFRLRLRNCIVTGNAGADIANGDDAATILNGGNIVQTVTNIGTGKIIGTFLNADPQLGALADNGGFTKTMALQPASPARDVAAESTATSDQRGQPIVGIADIGAYEYSNAEDFEVWVDLTLPDATPAQRMPTIDYDGDGQTNYAEWLAYTNPADGSDYLRILNIATEGENLKVTFRPVFGRRYHIETSSNNVDWTSGGAVPISIPTTTATLPGLATLPKLFLRLRVEEP